MRLVATLLVAVLFAVPGCVEEEPVCPDDQDAACTCDDGSEGELVCNDGVANCICDDEE